MSTYGFIGTGNMAQAMMKGLLRQGVPAKDIHITSPRSAEKLAAELGVVAMSPESLVAASDLVVLAFLPNQLEKIVQPLNLQDKLVVSVLAGVTLETLSAATKSTQIVRTLPNVNVAINQGVIAYASTVLSATHEKVFQQFVDSLGHHFDVSESQFATFSAVAGSGPAYVFKFIAALAQAGTQNGLEATLATKIATQTVLGSAEMLKQSDLTAQALQNAVASPGGSTRAGLDDFDTQNFDAVVAHAILATIKHKHL
ncbi:pyrroline-5-carboxylate reductase [Leuconostoc citreum]|uniref:pyrroline-5-carboxylate reductase n=1 Tax=Leuconostoc citreum TaxID=33964 RepID=UPI0021658FB3|nr:pyrroline-5-carboxylate reductase [Leuconostoc citreum]UVW16293.1 pyrroline-5-carboxylate reductase [Leuconostoc citreum]